MVFPAPSETRLTELGLLFTHLSSGSFELIAGRRKFLENGLLKTDSTLPHVLGLFGCRVVRITYKCLLEGAQMADYSSKVAQRLRNLTSD
jgi:hypothetical protein